MNELFNFATIDLTELNAQAELLRRFDTKYLVEVSKLPEMYGALPETTLVLRNRDVLSAPYTTTYYDTSELHTYYDHLKQRRKRFKIRTRFYSEPHDGYLEIKIKKPRGQTEKVRWHLDVSTIGETLSPLHYTLLNEALTSARYPVLHGDYYNTVQTLFTRTTLFDPVSRERITVDTDFDVHSQIQQLRLGPHHAIVEIKSPTKVGRTHRIFTSLGIRPISLSKYCLAMTALRPDLGGTPWREALRIMGTTRP